MAHNQQIEGILKAWWEWDHCAPNQKADTKRKLYGLLEAAIGDRPVTPNQLLEYLSPRYREFRAERRKADKIRIAQSVLGK
jgi:hypothetical protein